MAQKIFIFALSFFFSASGVLFAQSHQILSSDPTQITIKFNFADGYSIKDTVIDGRTFQKINEKDFTYRNPGEPWLPDYYLNIGIPHNAQPKVSVLNTEKISFANKFILPFPEADPQFEEYDVRKVDVNIYGTNKFFPSAVAVTGEKFEMRYAKVLPLSVAPFQFNPVTRELVFNKSVTIRIDYNSTGFGANRVNDPMTDEFLKNSVANYEQAKNWIGKSVTIENPSFSGGYWYDPNKNYFKLYIKKEGVYRVTYDELIAAGVPLGTNTPIDKIELFANEETVPIDIVDNGDQIFNSGDYFQFVGFPPPPSANSYLNIYNKSNVYWFSYQSDSTGNHYNNISGYPQGFSKTYYSSKHVLHFERDTLYERLGYSSTEQVDYWLWQKATAQGGQSIFGFEDFFDQFPNKTIDSNWVKLRIGMHGMTNNVWCSPDHKAYIEITDQEIGIHEWDGQEATIFEKMFYVSNDSINIFPTGNRLNVWVTGENCNPPFNNDEIRINWYEFEYWRRLRASTNHFDFKSHDEGVIRFWMTQWLRQNSKIYIPEKRKLITNAVITNDPNKSVIFMDTASVGTEYFCVADDYYLTVDSIVADQSSNLRNTANGADYIIIYHNKFESIAQQLDILRRNTFPDENIPNARVKMVEVHEIYDEFSGGLLDPYALNKFVKYAFYNWAQAAPSYVVLIGDMSYDYREILPTSRKNYIPSIPYFSFTYGQAASDNMIVAVVGTDVVPDLAIGRISIETVAEGNIMMDKLRNYPDDPGKKWKQNVLAVASGLSYEDQLNFGFNDASIELCEAFVEPQGFQCTKIFNFPEPEHIQYQGGGPEIREAINEGTVLVNYYGHGGGFQWDLIFTVDDIYLLENEGRLPLILSVTCYTSHFDNQDVFGEIFNKIEGKGSIGFFGSTGLTYWGVAKAMNREIFKDIFSFRNYIVGKAFLNAKTRIPGSGVYASQIALQTYLGDPVTKLALPEYPDFEISSSGISLTPPNPIIGDTISVGLVINNWGTNFLTDSVTVELFANSADTSYQIGITKRPNFPYRDSLAFTWIPNKGGLYELTAVVNGDDAIMEEDHSDNEASELFLIFNISEPNIVKPIDGYSTTAGSLEFVFADIGHYLRKDLTYYIEIDTSMDFQNPIITTPALSPAGAHLTWQSPNLPVGTYFWRARIFDGNQFGNWGPIKSFSIMSSNPKEGYYAHADILQSFESYNINYSDSAQSLRLNTTPLPPRPSNKTFLNNIVISPALADSLKLTALTTDGTYLYFANIEWIERVRLGGDGLSRIYRVGTGNNGTTEGFFYGPFSDFYDKVSNTLVYYDGHIYVPTERSHQLTRINVTTEVIDTVQIPPGLLRYENTTTNNGPVLLCSDGQYFYNLTLQDIFGNRKYTLRTLDPSNNFELAKPDMQLSGSSYEGFSGFFVHDEYIYVTETLNANFMRRIRLEDGFFEEEWIAVQPFQAYYAWTYDWEHDNIYASVYRASGFIPKFAKFAGEYVDANGSVTTAPVGPAAWWNDLEYDLVNPSPTGDYRADLLGFNTLTKTWDTVQVNIPNQMSLSEIKADEYSSLKLSFSLTDSSFTTVEPMELKSVHISYHPLSDVYFVRDDLQFDPDTVLQGFPISMFFKGRSYGDLPADSVDLKFYLNGLDSIIYTSQVSIPVNGTSEQVSYVIPSDRLLFENEIRAFGESSQRELFYFNNLIDNRFFVARDSVRPLFKVTFDGEEIIDGDIISSSPQVMIVLEDNSPLPLDTSYFTIVHNNIPLHFTDPDINYEYTPYPNSKATILWEPELEDGRHTLEILAKDASGNFFDSTSSRTVFNVFSEEDLREVYNYPNPFASETHFTFELRGTELPDEVLIRVYTIAGRLIRDIKIPSSTLKIGFNKIAWNGRDEDGDEIANGLYFYKVIAKFPDDTKSVTQKLAKVK